MEARTRILQQAEILFLRNGIKSVSMDDIATALSMSKKTLYKAFVNKDEIVKEAMTIHLHKAQTDCARIGNWAINAVHKMVLLSRWADKQLSEVHPSIIHDLRKYHPTTWALLREHQHTFMLKQITCNLQCGIAEGMFRPDLDVQVLARLQLAQIELVFNADIYPRDQFSALRIHKTFDEHFLRGIITSRGQQSFADFQQPDMLR